jgi:hypothetical protein
MIDHGIAAAIAIPARDEAGQLPACLDALARQTGGYGERVDLSAVAVVVFANNCTDGTAQVVRALAPGAPFRLVAAEAALPPGQAHAGGARRGAMDLAAAMLDRPGAALLSTDADGRSAPDWLAANLAALAAGADAVAGSFVPDPLEVALLPPALRAREEREAAYAMLLDELAWLIDPDPHDPWPRHGIHSGASMALSLEAYRRIGGLPAVPVGEDRALFDAVRRSGMRVRHCPAARVTVSCRLVGRAVGGMADTLSRRGLDAAAPTDPRLEPVVDAFWRFRCRHLFRRVQAGDARGGDVLRLALALQMPAEAVARAARQSEFWRGWDAVEAASPALGRRSVPASAVAREVATAKLLLGIVRGAASVASTAAGLLPRDRPRPSAAGRGGSPQAVPAG